MAPAVIVAVGQCGESWAIVSNTLTCRTGVGLLHQRKYYQLTSDACNGPRLESSLLTTEADSAMKCRSNARAVSHWHATQEHKSR